MLLVGAAGVGKSDAPAIPLIPIAAAVIVFDLTFLVVFTRSSREAIRQAELRELGVEPEGT